MDFCGKLLQWYDQNKRGLPWRQTKDPYAIWVSEIMLQQTRVDFAIGYYVRFLEHFKDVQALSKASEQEILNVWKGLGYYSRARNMHKAAKVICDQHGGVFPGNLETLKNLPGIGRYTGAAIASIAYNIPAPAVDGNVLRVITRIFAFPDDISKNTTKTKVEGMVRDLIPRQRAGDFTEALMELGATVCLPQTPVCENCPMQTICLAFQKGLTGQLPYKAPKEKPNPVVEYRVLYIRCKDKLLMEHRKNHTLLKNLWGLPMIEISENAEIKKYLQKEYGSSDYSEKGLVTHVFTHKTWKMHILELELAKECKTQAFQWMNIKDIPALPIPAAFQKALDAALL